MIQLLDTTPCSKKIEQILLGARVKVHLVSPFINPSSRHVDAIRDCEERRVRVYISCRPDGIHPKSELSPSNSKLVQWFYSPNLHAKFYFNETEALITSLNLLGSSMVRNLEIGILVTRDEPLFERLMALNREILRRSSTTTGRHGRRTHSLAQSA